MIIAARPFCPTYFTFLYVHHPPCTATSRDQCQQINVAQASGLSRQPGIYITSQSTLVPAVILRRVLNLNDSGRYIMSKKFLSFFIMWVPPLPIIKHPVVRQLELGPPIHPWDLQTSQIRPKRQVMPHLQQLVAATWVSATSPGSKRLWPTYFMKRKNKTWITYIAKTNLFLWWHPYRQVFAFVNGRHSCVLLVNVAA